MNGHDRCRRSISQFACAVFPQSRVAQRLPSLQPEDRPWGGRLVAGCGIDDACERECRPRRDPATSVAGGHGWLVDDEREAGGKKRKGRQWSQPGGGGSVAAAVAGWLALRTARTPGKSGDRLVGHRRVGDHVNDRPGGTARAVKQVLPCCRVADNEGAQYDSLHRPVAE